MKLGIAQLIEEDDNSHHQHHHNSGHHHTTLDLPLSKRLITIDDNRSNSVAGNNSNSNNSNANQSGSTTSRSQMLRVDSLPTISMAAPFANDRSFKEKVSLRNPSFDAASFKADPAAAGTSFFS